MKRSIRLKYLLALIGMAAAVMLISLLVLNLWLEPYYISQKQKTLVKVKNELEVRLASDSEVTDDTEVYLEQVKENYNIEITLWDSSKNTLYYSGNRKDAMDTNLMAYVLGLDTSEELLELADDYKISKTHDPILETDYLEMFASYPEGGFSIMRSPIQSIQTAVELMNRFMLLIFFVITMIAAGIALLLTRNLTAPIKKLSGIAERMADMDFTARYDGEFANEFDILGNSMNHMSEELEKSISEMKTANLELRKDIEKKEKMDEMRREFLSSVSHELKTPIALIQGYAEGLKDGISDDPDSMEFYCDVIMDEAGKMNTMVRRLLTLNQIEEGDEHMTMERFDLVEMISAILNSFRLMIEQKHVKAELCCPSQLFVWADTYRTEEVIRNYVSNALHYVKEGGKMRVKGTIENGRAKIEVFNEGSQIPEESLDRLWDKFYKVDKARTREYGGNGIGLSIVKAVMESMNCGYGVRNEENGVTFWADFDAR